MRLNRVVIVWTLSIGLMACDRDSGRKSDDEVAGAGPLPEPATSPLAGDFEGQAFQLVFGAVDVPDTAPDKFDFSFLGAAPENRFTFGTIVGADSFCIPFGSDDQEYTSILAGTPKAAGTHAAASAFEPGPYVNMVTHRESGTNNTIADAATIIVDPFDDTSTQITGTIIARYLDTYTLNGRFWAYRCDLPAAPTAFEGHWITPIDSAGSECVDGSKKSVVVKDSTLFYLTDVYADAKCVNQLYAGLAIFTIKVGTAAAAGKPVDLTLVHANITPVEGADMTELAKRQLCGVSDWVEKRTRDVTGLTCEHQPYAAKDHDAVVYELWNLKDGQFSFGKLDAAHDGTSAAKRPVAVDETKPFEVYQ